MLMIYILLMSQSGIHAFKLEKSIQNVKESVFIFSQTSVLLGGKNTNKTMKWVNCMQRLDTPFGYLGWQCCGCWMFEVA